MLKGNFEFCHILWKFKKVLAFDEIKTNLPYNIHVKQMLIISIIEKISLIFIILKI